MIRGKMIGERKALGFEPGDRNYSCLLWLPDCFFSYHFTRNHFT